MKLARKSVVPWFEFLCGLCAFVLKEFSRKNHHRAAQRHGERTELARYRQIFALVDRIGYKFGNFLAKDDPRLVKA